MRTILFICLIAMPNLLMAQPDGFNACPASKAYHAKRSRSTKPPYSLAKIQQLIKAIKPIAGENSDEETTRLNPSILASLSIPEQFTYHMIHPESYTQNCDIDMPIINEEKKLFAYPPNAFAEGYWSQSQKDFFIKNKTKVLALIQESATRTKYLGANYKEAICVINSPTIIPFLISFYKKYPKDGDILTVLMILMKENNYTPFTASTSYQKLYAEGSAYQSFLDFNPANEKLIIDRATAFYQSTKK